MAKIAAEVRTALFSGTPPEQIKALDIIGKQENDEGYHILVQALFTPRIAVKKQICNLFSNIKDKLLLQIWQEELTKVSKEVLEEVQEVFRASNFTEKFIDQGLSYFNEQDKILNIIGIARILSVLGKKQPTLDYLRRMLTHRTENVKLVAIDGFARVGDKSCLNNLLYAVKAYGERVAMKSLDLIARFKEDNTILPLMYAISSANAIVSDLIIKTLTSFGKEKVTALMVKHATPDDKQLLKNAILVCEKMGDRTLAENLMRMYRDEAQTISTGKKILLASDVYLSRLQIEKILKDKYEITEVTNGTQVLQELAKGIPSLIIIDKNLPVMSGIETIQHIRSKNKNLPVLVFFSHINKIEKSKLSDLGVSGYLLKPFDDQEVKKAVIRAIDESHKEESLDKFANSFKPGQTIFNEGDQGSACFIIKTGHVRIIKKLPNGRDMILAELVPGDLFGEMALIESADRSAGAMATENTTLITVGKENFELMVRQKPEFAMKLIEIFSDRLRKSNETIRNLLAREQAAY